MAMMDAVTKSAMDMLVERLFCVLSVALSEAFGVSIAGDCGDVGCMAGGFGALPAVPCFVVLLFMFTLGVYCVD